MLDQLSRDERLRLMRFVCSFAWADLAVHKKERKFVARLIDGLDLDREERRHVDGWLETPPAPESVDPTEIPPDHRRLFLSLIEEVVDADDEISPEELETLSLFRELLD